MKKYAILLFAMLLVTGLTLAQNNTSTLNQFGQDQTAVIDQQGEGVNTSLVVQHVRKNKADITQINDQEYATDLNFSEVSQEGIENYARVVQDYRSSSSPDPVSSLKAAGGGGSLTANINQLGRWNKAFQYQGPHEDLGYTGANINQTGDQNYARQSQLRKRNGAMITQLGNRNRGVQEQNLLMFELGSNNSASILQQGNDNNGLQTQDGQYNNATALQYGNDNTAVQEQLSYSPVEGEKIVVTTNNVADVLQSGQGNLARQYQEKDSDFGINAAETTQIGNNNRAFTNQLEGSNWSIIWQEGSGHKGTVYQRQGITYFPGSL